MQRLLRALMSAESAMADMKPNSAVTNVEITEAFTRHKSIGAALERRWPAGLRMTTRLTKWWIWTSEVALAGNCTADRR
jgi:hypothetical protein